MSSLSKVRLLSSLTGFLRADIGLLPGTGLPQVEKRRLSEETSGSSGLHTEPAAGDGLREARSGASGPIQAEAGRAGIGELSPAAGRWGVGAVLLSAEARRPAACLVADGGTEDCGLPCSPGDADRPGECSPLDKCPVGLRWPGEWCNSGDRVRLGEPGRAGERGLPGECGRESPARGGDPGLEACCSAARAAAGGGGRCMRKDLSAASKNRS